MSTLTDLLAVQGLDTSLDQLRHRRDTHPARARVRQLEGDIAAVEAQRSERSAERDELLRQQRRWDDEVTKVASRRSEVDATLYGGTVTSPKELLALQADVQSLKRRQSELEDHELEVMEQVEAVSSEIDTLDASAAALRAQLEEARAELTAATAEIEVEIDRLTAQREAAVTPLPAGLVARYEALRAELGGVAVVRLHGSSCEGCHLTLSAMTIDQLKKLPPDELAHCEDCGRILVR